MHRIHADQPLASPGQTMLITGDEAEHAIRSKRLEAGENVELLDGRGGVAAAVVVHAGRAPAGRRGESALEVRIERVGHVEQTRPVVEVWAATPKGSRVDDMIDQLTQVGAASWTPLHCDRSVVNPGQTKLHRLDRIAWEAAKQAGRAWVLQVNPERPFADALAQESAGTRVVVAHAGEPSYAPATGEHSGRIRLVIGPEGGFSDAELARAEAAAERSDGGLVLASFGPHTMRIETAAAVAAAVILSTEGVR